MKRAGSTHTSADAPLDPAVVAELDQLDAALRGEPIDDDTLAALVRDVQAQTPVLGAEPRAALNELAATGFPRRALGRGRQARRSERPGTGSRRPGRLLLGGGAVAASLSFVLVLGVFLLQSETGELSISGGGGLTDMSAVSDAFTAGEAASPMAQAATPESAAGSALSGRAPAQVDPLSATVVGSSSSFPPSASSAPTTGKRQVQRRVDLSVRIKSGQLGDAAGEVGDITRQAGGFVADSQVSVRTRGAGDGRFRLTVATSRLDAAVDRLSGLGTVTAQDQTSTDITSAFDSTQGRLDDATAERRALLRALARADTAGQIASLRSRIADNRALRARLDADLQRLQRRTDLTTISLKLWAPSGDAPSADDDGQWSIGDAAGDAVDILGTVSGVLLVSVAALLPFGILAAIAWAVFRTRRRRQRDAALD